MAEVSGGEKLERALAELARQVSHPATLRVGFFSGATYPDGKSVAMVAALNEFGTARIPSRPFFRNMIREKSAGWPRAIAANLVANHYDPIETLNDVGDAIVGQLQVSIRNMSSPPNAPSTIARKGFDDPLIESGYMLSRAGKEVTVGNTIKSRSNGLVSFLSGAVNRVRSAIGSWFGR